jgi:uncharacterized protein YfaS (alpha-2-macroglobulin family)
MELISKAYRHLLLTVICGLGLSHQAWAQQAYDSAAFDTTKTELKVLRITPQGVDVPTTNRQIVIKFNQAVVAIGDMKIESQDVPVDITPNVNCQWLWLDTSSLSCQLKLEDKLKEASKYAITLRPGIKTLAGSVMANAFNHSFSTQRPSLDYVYLLNWLSAGKPLVSMVFNQPITKSSVEKYVQLKSGSGQLITVVAKREANPLTDHYYRQATSQSNFVELDYISLGDSEKSKAVAINRANAERGEAHDQARNIWNITPTIDLPANTDMAFNIGAGIKSIHGLEVGLENRGAHHFKSLPRFEFFGVNCSAAGTHAAIAIKPLYSSTQNLRKLDGEKVSPSIEECDPLDRVSLSFSTPISYASAKNALSLLPDIAGGRTDYDPWTVRDDSNSLSYFFSRRFDYGNNQPYQLQLPESLRALDQYRLSSNNELMDELGRTIDQAIDMSFLTSHRAPRLHYDHAHSVLEKTMQTDLPVTVTNLDTLKVENYSSTTSTQRKELNTFDTKLADTQDVAYAVPLGVRQLLENQSGITVGTLASDPLPANYGPEQYRFVSQVTPFAVHFKFGQFNSYAWVTDMATGKPVEGAALRLDIEQYSSIQPFGDQTTAIKTDADGVAKLPGIEQLDPQLEYSNRYNFEHQRIMLKVAKGDDFAVLPLDYEYQAWSQVQHRLQTKDSYLHAWGTTAQGVYKAGDTIQYKLWVRNQDNRHWVAANTDAYTLEVMDPKGQRVQHIQDLSLSEFGSYDGELKTTESASIGWYDFVLSYKANGNSYQRYPMRVLLSDFTPSAFRVSTELNGDQFQAGDTVSVNTLAKMHAGGPYADAQTRVTAQLRAKSFSSQHPEAKGFNFNSTNQGGSQTVHQSNGSVDKSGELLTKFKLNDFDLHFGRVQIESAVRDDRGKYVTSRASADYLGRDLFIGLRNTQWTHEVGKKAAFEHLVVNPSGEPVKDVDVNLTIEHYVTRAARVKGAGNAYLTQYSSEWIETDQCKQTSRLRRVSCEFIPTKPGRYRITASLKDSKGRENSNHLSTWVVGEGTVLWAGADNNDIEIIPDAASYKIGDVAKLLVKNPYPGAEALITVERYGVKRHWRKTLDNSTPIIEIPIEDDDYPGIYVSVVVTSPRVAQPLGQGNVDLGKPAFKMGYVKIQVDDSNKQIEVNLSTNKKVYKPREQVRVKLKAKPRTGKVEPMEVAIVVIDEAVFDLNLSGKAYYDPYQGFNKLDSLGVANYNLLMKLIGRQKFEKKGANPGGGGGSSDNSGSLRNLMKFVAYWNPSLELDKKGKAKFEFELPDNLSGWRVFAMAVTKQEKMGLGDINFKVNRPTELRPVMPNQLTEGDQVQAGFSVMNRTKKPRTLNVELRAAGSALTEPVVKKVKVALAAFERKQVWLEIKADAPGEIALLAKAGDSMDKDAVEHHIPVAKRRSLITASTYGTTTGESVSVNFAYPEDIYLDVGGLSLEVSPSVIGNITGAFGYLKNYPHACWEQRLSKGLAASQYSQLKQHLPDSFNWPESADLAEQTLASAARFQAPNGGMSYWINNNQYTSPYLSAYTALGFVWLRDQGYAIPTEVENKLHEYLETYLRGDVKSDSVNELSMRGVQASVRAVALAALAARGKIDKAQLLRYQSHVPDMDLFGKAHYLQAATALDVDEQKLLELSQNILSYSVQSGGKFQFNEQSFYGASSIHTTAMRSNCAVLTSLLGVTAKSRKAFSIIGDVPFKQVRSIIQTRGGRDYWGNTQENLYCMNALLNFSKAYENEAPNMLLMAASVTKKYATTKIGSAKFSDVRDVPVTMSNPQLPVEPGLSGAMELSKQGSGRVYYQMQMSYAKKQNFSQAVNAGIQINREYSVQVGDKWQVIASPMQLEKGQLVRVDLFVSTPTARQFVVINDPIPGGLEPVNRDLATTSVVDSSYHPALGSRWFDQADWVPYGQYGWSFYHQELRHDSARFYSDNLPLGNYHLSYTAQAIAGGEFSVMPVRIEEMYDPDVYGLGLPATLKVEHASD